MKTLTDDTYLSDPSIRLALDRAHRLRQEAIERLVVAPLIAACKRMFGGGPQAGTPRHEHATFTLQREALMRIENGRGRPLHVEHGRVWVTQHGSPDDVILEAGESWTIDRDGLTLVTSCSRAGARFTLGRAGASTPTLAARRTDFRRAFGAA